MGPDLSMVMGDMGLTTRLPATPGVKPSSGNSSTGGVTVAGVNPLATLVFPPDLLLSPHVGLVITYNLSALLVEKIVP